MPEIKKNQGGRPKGKLNVSTVRRKAIAERVERDLVKKKATPLEIMARVMNGDVTVTEMQFEAAKAAAPYIHPKLSAVQMNATVRRSVEDMTDEELVALANDGEGESEG
jgi:hypothetical protein